MTNNQNTMTKRRYPALACRLGLFLPLITFALPGANAVYAGTCEKPVCKRKEIYLDGICHRSTGYPTYIRSQYKAACESGWELVRSRGVCVKTRCKGVTLQPLKPRPKAADSRQAGVNEKPVCRPKETYRDGYCHYSTGYPTYTKVKTKATCQNGWRLDAGRAVCIKN